MENQGQENQEDTQEQPKSTRTQKLVVAGSVALVSEPFLMAASHQQGVVATLVAGFVGWGVYTLASDLEKKGRALPALPRLAGRKQRDPGQLPVWYRIINGKSTRDDTEPVTEELDAETAAYIESLPVVRSDDGLPPVFGFLNADEMLQLGELVETGQRFDPHMDYVLGRGVLLAGTQGTGKSNIIALIAVSAGRCRMPSLIIDYKGEFWPLCKVVPNGLLVGHPTYAEDAGSIPFFGLTVETAEALAEKIMKEPCQAVLDIPSFQGNGDEIAMCVSALLQSMMNWAIALRRRGKEPWPALVIVDEAHNYVPQNRNLSGFAMKHPQESFNNLTSAFANVANAGRSFGYTLVMATQRLPNIAKWSIGNLQVKVILAHTLKNDLDSCEEETGGLIDREDIKQLETGTGIVMGLTTKPVVVAFDKQPAQHVSNTPKVGRIKEQFSPSVSPSIAVGVSPSAAPSDFAEVAPSATGHSRDARNGSTGQTKEERRGAPLRQLSEREKRIGEMFFIEGKNPNAIIKIIYPDIKGGDAYQKASAEIAEALRKYVLCVDLTKESEAMA